MRRITVEAGRDPRARPQPMAGTDAGWAARLPMLDETLATTLLAVARTIAPHDWLDDQPYRHAVAAIAEAMAHSAELTADIGAFVGVLDRAFPIPFVALSEGNRVLALRRHEDVPVFRELVRIVQIRLYDDPVVWAGCGYDGAAGCADGRPRTDILAPALDPILERGAVA